MIKENVYNRYLVLSLVRFHSIVVVVVSVSAAVLLAKFEEAHFLLHMCGDRRRAELPSFVLGARRVVFRWQHAFMLSLGNIFLEQLLGFRSFPARLSSVVRGRHGVDQSIGAEQGKFLRGTVVLCGKDIASALEAIFKEALRFLGVGSALVPTTNSGRRL